MADIFVSYARQDYARVGPLVTQLEAAGYTVWWDQNLAGGVRYANVIESEISAATHVIVIWSKASVESQWVTDEAAMGRDLNKLIPILMDGVSPPIGFRQLQSIDFSAWGEDQDEKIFQDLQSSLSQHHIRRSPKTAMATPTSDSGQRPTPNVTLALAILVIMVLGIAGLYFLFQPQQSSLPDSDQGLVEGVEHPASIAVLPFEEAGTSDEASYFSEGITIDIISRLQTLRLFPVISKNSSFSFRGQAMDAREIAKTLGADYIVAGTVRRSGDQIRVTAQLIEAETGYAIWSDTYDRPFGEIFELQDDLTLSIASAIAPEIKRSEMLKARRKQITDPTAYDLYLQGIRLSRTEDFEEVQRAKSALKQAVEIDPTFATPYVELAWIEHDRITYYASQTTWDQSVEARDKALAYGRKAISLDPQLAEAHTVYGHMLLHYRQSEEGLAALKRGVDLNPSSADNRANYGWGLVSNGLYREAIEEYKKASKLNPNDPRVWEAYQNIGYAELLSGNYEAAIASTQRGLAINPDNFYSYLTLICAYSKLGETQRAEAAFLRFGEIAPGFSTKSLELTSFSDEAIQIFSEALFAFGWVDAY